MQIFAPIVAPANLPARWKQSALPKRTLQSQKKASANFAEAFLFTTVPKQ